MGKRIAAIIGLVAIALMYIVSLVAAILATPVAHQLFQASIVLTIFVPVVLWIYIRLYERAHQNEENGMSMREVKKLNKRIKAGEDPNAIAEEIEKKYGDAEKVKSEDATE